MKGLNSECEESFSLPHMVSTPRETWQLVSAQLIYCCVTCYYNSSKMTVSVCVCLQLVRVRVCWSAGTVSAFLPRFAATARTTAKMAAMKTIAP